MEFALGLGKASTNDGGGAEIDQPLPFVSVSIYILDRSKCYHRVSTSSIMTNSFVQPGDSPGYMYICRRFVCLFLRTGFWRDGRLLCPMHLWQRGGE